MSIRSIVTGSLVIAPLVAAALAGCDRRPDLYGDIPEDIALRSFNDCGDMREYVEDAVLEQLVMSRYGYWGWGILEDGAEMSGDADYDAPTNDEPTDYTTTNVQEQGVDEVDIVKTDGQFLYVTEGEFLYVVSSWPVEEASLVGKVEIGGYPYGLFLNGDQAVVFSQHYDDGGEEPVFERSWSSTRATFVDVSDRHAPTVTRTVDFEGYYASGRMVGDDVWLVLNSYLPLPEEAWDLIWNGEIELPEWDWEASEARQEQIRDEAREILRPYVHDIVQGMSMEEILPLMLDQEAGANEAEPEAMVGCGNVYQPADLSRFSMMSISHIELGSGDIATTGVLSDGWTVYASQENLYVAESSWYWWWGWGDVDMTTRIHKFELGNGAPDYRAAGEVDGWLLNQFSMSEYNGDLRVASTQTDWWWGTGTDDGGAVVTVLRDFNGALTEIGAIRDFAPPEEQIQGVRMMGEKGYVVTFEQTDPLWTIDLSDPHNPSVAGELQLPGYSSYLHPVGDNYLLAVGMAGDMSGNLTGLAVTLFDVSDFSEPRVADQFTLENEDYAWSEALWDHHAFTFHRGVLTIPVYIYDWSDYDGYGDSFSGMLALYVHPVAGITELGRVDHRDLIEDSDCIWDYYGGCDPYYYWYASMRRSVYVEDNLFSISDYGVKVNELNDPEVEIARVLFHPAQ